MRKVSEDTLKNDGKKTQEDFFQVLVLIILDRFWRRGTRLNECRHRPKRQKKESRRKRWRRVRRRTRRRERNGAREGEKYERPAYDFVVLPVSVLTIRVERLPRRSIAAGHCACFCDVCVFLCNGRPRHSHSDTVMYCSVLDLNGYV